MRTHGGPFTEADGAARLAGQGVHGVVVPLFSQVSAVHDRLAERPGALVDALRAMRALDAAGVRVHVETPLLSPRVQDLPAVLDLARRAVPALASFRAHAVPGALPPAVAPPSWEVLRAPLREAFARAREHGVAAKIHDFDGVPLCVLGHDDDASTTYQFNPRRPVAPRAGFAQLAPCASCAVRAHCLGPLEGYAEDHGDAGLRPFAARPRRLFEQRTTPRRAWTDAHRAAASRVVNRVLRPTIHCNQDCSFCSANETSENVIPDAGAMLRRIARLARMGVRVISFGGGEPTLSRDLVHYVRAASRLGVAQVELVTNGVRLDGPEKVRPLAEAGLTRAFVSLHGHDEALSRRATAKIGDWERTVRAVDALLDAGVAVDVNHVITAVNHPYLARFADFVADRWGGRVGISFAFVTPQFKALEDAAQMPRISEVRPYLRRAMRRLEARRNPFVVGSRQGIPPCFMGEFTAWNDFVSSAPQAMAEDEPQKVRGPQCGRCRFAPVCAGLWRPYAARHGFDELVPVPGDPLTDEETAHLAVREPPRSFDDVHPALRTTPDARDLADDAVEPAEPSPEPSPATSTVRRLPVLHDAPGVRAVLLGAGPYAQRLLRASRGVPGLAFVGVASPHVLDRDPGPFAGLARHADPAALLDALRPGAVVVAAATAAHLALARLAVERGLPVLVAGPLAHTLDEAEALVQCASLAPLMAASEALFSPGILALRERVADGGSAPPRRVQCVRRWTALDPDAPPSWSREGLARPLHDAAARLVAFGAGEPSLLRVELRGASRPSWLRAEFALDHGAAGEVVLDATAAAGADEVALFSADRARLAWRRDDDGAETLLHDTPLGERSTSAPPRSPAEAMLEAFREVVASGRPVPTTALQGLAAMRVVRAVLAGVAERTANPDAPRHVASPALRER